MRSIRTTTLGVCAMLVLAVTLTAGVDVFAQGYGAEKTGLTEAAKAAKYNVNQTCIRDAGGCLPQLMGDVVNALLGIFGALFLVLILYGGGQYMLAGGSPDKVKAATTTIRNAIVGMVIVASSWAITSFVLDTLSTATTPTEGATQTDVPLE